MHWRAAFEQQIGFFRFSFEQQVELESDQGFLFLLADVALDRHQVFAAALYFSWRYFIFEIECSRSFLIGIRESPHPVELRFAYKVTEFFEFFFGLSGESDNE